MFNAVPGVCCEEQDLMLPFPQPNHFFQCTLPWSLCIYTLCKTYEESTVWHHSIWLYEQTDKLFELATRWRGKQEDQTIMMASYVWRLSIIVNDWNWSPGITMCGTFLFVVQHLLWMIFTHFQVALALSNEVLQVLNEKWNIILWTIIWQHSLIFFQSRHQQSKAWKHWGTLEMNWKIQWKKLEWRHVKNNRELAKKEANTQIL